MSPLLRPVLRTARSPVLLCALLLPLAARAADAPASSTAPPATTTTAAQTSASPAAPPARNEAEWQAYKDTLERYRDRANELFGDVREIVDLQEQDQRAALVASYQKLNSELEGREGTFRVQAEAQIKAFLDKYPSSPHTADMEFRLADLYFEDSELQFFAASADYSRLEDQADKNPALVLPPPPAKDYSRSIALYQRIIAEHPDYSNLPDTYYMLAWCYSAANAAQFDEDKAREVNEIVAARYPHTPFSNDANMRLGEYWFDKPGPRDAPSLHVPTAIKYYEAVLAEGPTGRNYDEAIYKLGWSSYKLNDYDGALAYLVQLLDYSDAQFQKTGKVSPMRPEAIEYLAISYADIAFNQSKKPVVVAESHLSKIGAKKWEHDVIERLSEILATQAKYDESIDTLRYLQDHWPLDPKNPIYQQRIAVLYGTMPIPDEAAAAEAMAQLSERYSEGTAWYEANRGNPDAIAAARGFIETSLAAVAVDYLQRANDSQRAEDYRLAAKKLSEFINTFPLANDYNLYEWYWAVSLFGAKDYVAAEGAYAQILKNDASPYRDSARYQIMKCREAVLLAKYQKHDTLPADAVVENVLTTPAGTQVTRYVIDKDHASFMAAADDLIGREFSAPDAAKLLERDKPALIYITGQILYAYGHLEEARQRFDKLIAEYPHTDEAVYASSLYINSLVAEGNLEAVRLYGTKFLAMDLGKDPLLHQGSVSEITDIREQAAFGLAQKYVEKDDRENAARAFVDFMKEYPSSKFYKDALYNAGKSYSLSGHAADAIRLFEDYVQRYPSDERSQYLYTQIAENYSATMDLDRAVQNYDLLVKTFPSSPDAPSAIYNAAFLRVGLGDHAKAAAGYERYATQFPGQPDAEDAYFRAGAQWELVSDGEATDFYTRYLKRYPSDNASHAIEAAYKLAKLAEKRRDTRRADAAYAQIRQIYTAAAGKGVTDHARGLAAEGALKDLLAALEAFKAVKWTSSEAKNVELLTKTKADERKAIEGQATELIATYQDFDTAAAALYIQAMSYFAYADMAYSIPTPKGMSDDEIDIYRQAVDDRFRLPAEDRGKARLVTALDKAKAEKRWSTWDSKALTVLHDRYPFEYPSERQESRGTAAEGQPPFEGPADLVVPEKEEAP